MSGTQDIETLKEPIKKFVEKQATKRRAIGKKARFEVFKRDSFKCTYCGAAGEQVQLHVDHIVPVSEGGTNDLMNLVTACAPCNLGKSDRKLDDNTAAARSRNQAEEQQAIAEQIEMMAQWRAGLAKIQDDATDRIVNYWNTLTPGIVIKESAYGDVKKIL
jgi:hypothetical protein